jgi:hypothetical protein
MKFTRRRIGKKRTITKREMKRLLRSVRPILNSPQDLMNHEVTYCIGKLCLGFSPKESEERLLKLIKTLKRKDYRTTKINQMVRKASNRYRFGFETPRIIRGVKGFVKEDRW